MLVAGGRSARPAKRGGTAVKAERMLKVLAAFLFAPLCVAAQEPRAPAGVDVAALVSEARKNGEAVSRRVFEYSWTTQTRVRRLNKPGGVV